MPGMWQAYCRRPDLVADDHEYPHACRRLQCPDSCRNRRRPGAGGRGPSSARPRSWSAWATSAARQLASSPLSAEARGGLRPSSRELAGVGATAPARPQGHAGAGRERHHPDSTLECSGKARASSPSSRGHPPARRHTRMLMGISRPRTADRCYRRRRSVLRRPRHPAVPGSSVNVMTKLRRGHDVPQRAVVQGAGRNAGRSGQADVRSALPRPGATDQQASSSAGANRCGALTHAP